MAESSERDRLVERLRALLVGEPSVREVSMFGGRSFMVDDKMVVSAFRGGELLVRVDAERHDELVARTGAVQAEMGAGRSMGPGWVTVAPSAVADDDGLSSWLDLALEHRRAVAEGSG
jgi:TfoX/Sxy family transcriptional regulator of competence genes